MNANIISIYKTNNCSLINTQNRLFSLGRVRTAEDDKYRDGVGTGTTVQKIVGNGMGMGNNMVGTGRGLDMRGRGQDLRGGVADGDVSMPMQVSNRHTMNVFLITF